MITFKNISYTYPNTTQPALANLNLHLPEGDFALLVGPSGAGKSTLLRSLNGLVPHFSGGHISGKLTVNGLNPIEATPQVLSQHVGFVFQNPEAQFVLEQVEDEIAFALENAAMPPQEMRVRVEEVLDLLDLAPLRERRLETLSGGEKQRVAIASALALRPKILVLDEPTSQLDPKSAEDVLQTLVRLNSDLGLTILLAEHRMERVLPFVDTLIYLTADGQTMLADDPREVLGQIDLVPPLVALGKKLNWQPLPLTIKEGRRFSRKMTIPAQVSQPTETAQAKSKNPVLRVENLRVHYQDKPILYNLSLTLEAGEVVVLMGRNGAGKTTLLKRIVGLVEGEGGQIYLRGETITTSKVADICKQVGYLPQDPNALLFAETVQEELEITLRNHGFKNRNGHNHPNALPISPQALLAHLGLEDKAQVYPRDLSTGERQRVALGAIMITKPQVLLLDEPTRGLDYTAKARLSTLLQTWRDEGMAILMITHDVELAARLANRVILLSQGEIIAQGNPREVLGSSPLFAPQVARLFPETGWLTVADVLGNFNLSGSA